MKYQLPVGNIHFDEIMYVTEEEHQETVNLVKTPLPHFTRQRHTPKQMFDAQQMDLTTRTLSALVKGDRPDWAIHSAPYFAQITKYFKRHKQLWFHTTEGVLARRRNKTEIELIILPQSMQQAVLFLAHEASAHRGEDKTYEFIRRRFDWYGLKKSV